MGVIDVVVLGFYHSTRLTTQLGQQKYKLEGATALSWAQTPSDSSDPFPPKGILIHSDPFF